MTAFDSSFVHTMLVVLAMLGIWIPLALIIDHYFCTADLSTLNDAEPQWGMGAGTPYWAILPSGEFEAQIRNRCGFWSRIFSSRFSDLWPSARRWRRRCRSSLRVSARDFVRVSRSVMARSALPQLWWQQCLRIPSPMMMLALPVPSSRLDPLMPVVGDRDDVDGDCVKALVGSDAVARRAAIVLDLEDEVA